MNLATVDAAGVPQVRTVVLRAADKDTRRISFHTDQRSRKLVDLGAQNVVALHFHSRRHGIQLRLSGIASSSSEHDRSVAWHQLHQNAKAAYAQILPPGTRLEPHDNNDLVGTSNTQDGYSNFLVIDVCVSSVDWLELDRKGHRRALLTYSPSGNPEGAWIAP